MKLTNETLGHIKDGDVVKFTYPNGTSKTGVVFGIPAEGNWGILCKRINKEYFGVEKFDGTIEFELVKEHEPVAMFGFDYDFVSNHQ